MNWFASFLSDPPRRTDAGGMRCGGPHLCGTTCSPLARLVSLRLSVIPYIGIINSSDIAFYDYQPVRACSASAEIYPETAEVSGSVQRLLRVCGDLPETSVPSQSVTLSAPRLRRFTVPGRWY